MKLYFYIDKKNYPYNFTDLSLENRNLIRYSAPSTWLSWTLITYLHLRDYYNCVLVDTMPQEGVILFFRGSVSLNNKPNRHQFWICMVADGSPHPFAHVNVFQNPVQKKKHKGKSYFIRHWPQLNILKSERKPESFENLYFFGNEDNLAQELKSEDWRAFTIANNFKFKIQDASNWHDYKETDAIIAIRSFNEKQSFDSKPASKLINSWLANTIFISTPESAYIHEVESKYDMVIIHSYLELKEKLLELKNSPEVVKKYKLNAKNLQKKYKIERYITDWKIIIDDINSHSSVPSRMKHALFIIKRFILLKTQAISLKIHKGTRGK